MTDKPKRARGRPPKPVATSYDEAAARLTRGELPYRPRNEFERAVMAASRGRGRLSDTHPTRQAAMLAEQLVNQDGETLAGASRKAAEIHGLKPETVRKYARKLLRGPTVVLTRSITIMGVRCSPKGRVPLVVPEDEASERFGDGN